MPGDYDDYESPVSSLDDVCDRLDRIEEAIKENHWQPVSLVWAVLVVIAVVVWVPDMWHSKARYAWSHDISTDQVTVEPRPKDCDFFHVPIGDKGCEYKRQVSSVRIRTDSSDLARGPVREVSYDDGETWNVDTSVPATQPRVVISWEKVEDQ